MRFWSSVLIVAVGIASAHPATAGVPGGTIGATSRAVLRISVSVRPQFAVSLAPGGANGQGLCLTSTDGPQFYTLTLFASGRAHAAIDARALPSALACSPERAQIKIDRFRAEHDEPVLLLIAPQ
jgi:hypothetical protein